jgi:hypothetical protein
MNKESAFSIFETGARKTQASRISLKYSKRSESPARRAAQPWEYPMNINFLCPVCCSI